MDCKLREEIGNLFFSRLLNAIALLEGDEVKPNFLTLLRGRLVGCGIWREGAEKTRQG